MLQGPAPSYLAPNVAGLGHAGTWFLNSAGPAPKALHTNMSLEAAERQGEQKSKATREVGKHRSPSLQ